jgi:nitrogen PTS system EIIA component
MTSAKPSGTAPIAIRDFLSVVDVLVDFGAPGKAALLRDLSRRAAAALQLDAALIQAELTKREDLGSTGIGSGLAVPHARIAGLGRPFGILTRLARPIEFDSIDGRPVDVVFLLLLPLAPAAELLNALAGVSRKLRDPERMNALRTATNTMDLYNVLTRD